MALIVQNFLSDLLFRFGDYFYASGISNECHSLESFCKDQVSLIISHIILFRRYSLLWSDPERQNRFSIDFESYREFDYV